MVGWLTAKRSTMSQTQMGAGCAAIKRKISSRVGSPRARNMATNCSRTRSGSDGVSVGAAQQSMGRSLIVMPGAYHIISTTVYAILDHVVLISYVRSPRHGRTLTSSQRVGGDHDRSERAAARARDRSSAADCSYPRRHGGVAFHRAALAGRPNTDPHAERPG